MTLGFLITALIASQDLAPQTESCEAIVKSFSIETAENILKQSDPWLKRIESACPSLPKTVIETKRKALEPCSKEEKNTTAACLSLVNGLKSAVATYWEYRNMLAVVPNWVTPYLEFARSWFEYFKSFWPA